MLDILTYIDLYIIQCEMAVAASEMNNVDFSDPDGGPAMDGSAGRSKSTSSTSSPTKYQNGNAMMVVDRYGFIGGSQYTDPEE